MSHYTPQKFTLPELSGISKKNIEEHMKLYEGYVKNTNTIIEKMQSDPGASDYATKEMRRRLAFEFDGMRNHEYFFEQWEEGAVEPSDSELIKKIESEFGSFENWKNDFIELAKTRGIGWAILYYDPIGGHLLNTWVDEQHLGHLTGLQVIVALDMWEHAFVYDYATSEKADYIDAWYKNLNWSKIEARFN